MPTLLMRLEAPMQSYGVFGKFGIKDSGKEPSKSAVIGLICAALGIERSENITWITDLNFGIRVDREGIERIDYHIAGIGGIMQADGKKLAKNIISHRSYLADASFLVGIESEDIAKLEKIQEALKNPKWQIFLGKKSFVPSLPVWIPDGIKEGSLLEALKDYPFDSRHLRTKHTKDTSAKLRFVLDKSAASEEDITMISRVMDVPISFERRIFGERETASLMIDVNVEDK